METAGNKNGKMIVIITLAIIIIYMLIANDLTLSILKKLLSLDHNILNSILGILALNAAIFGISVLMKDSSNKRQSEQGNQISK